MSHIPPTIAGLVMVILAADAGAVPLDVALTRSAAPVLSKDGGAVPCAGGRAGDYSCEAIDLMAHLDLSALGAGSGNDIWGWTDPRDGREYALMGVDNGTVFVNVTDASAPTIVGRLPTQTAPSSWRDMKVYRDHLFVVSEAGGHGMQVFNLRRLRNNLGLPARTYRAAAAVYTGFGSAHNLAINEATGFAYAVGTQTCSGGLHMIDVREPGAPRFVGCFDRDGYTHDVQCVIYRGPDAAFQGSEICFAANEDTVTVVDVTDKANPSMLSRVGYSGSGYTHQGWLSTDQALFFSNDELDERRFGHNTRTYVWDVSDLALPVLVRRYEHETDTIDHNLYVVGSHVFQANYTSGLRVMEIINPRNGRMRRAGYFDVFPGDDLGAAPLAKHDDGDHEGDKGDGDALFDGAWSVYPYFASGTVVVSSISGGLYVLRPTFAFEASGGGGIACDEPLGGGRFCSACGPCGDGQGDCDADSECGPGLSCVDNVGAQFGFAPGVDVCMSNGGGAGGACGLPAGNGRFCDLCGPCGEGEGDCDGNDECALGLSCVDNVGAQFGFAPGVDVCLDTGGAACPVNLGTGTFCSVCGPCGEGEGDCDNHGECAPGLSCVDNVGAQFGFAPGVDVCVAAAQ